MIKFKFNLIFIFFIAVFIFSCAKQDMAQDVIFDFYNKYLSSSIKESEKKEIIKKYCTKNMLEVLDILYSFDEEEGLIVGIDYDPFVNAQEIPSIENLKIEKQNKTDYKIFLWGKNDRGVKLTLKEENNSWKIDSVYIENFEQIRNGVNDYWTKKGKNNPKFFSN